MKITDFLDEFVESLKEQLKESEETKENSQSKISRRHEERIMERFGFYFDRINDRGKNPPRGKANKTSSWLKIAESAFIYWLKENHPEYWKK